MVTYWTSFHLPVIQDTIVDVKFCNFVSDHALVKCSIAFPHQVAHIPNKVQYRRYHRINMSDIHSDLKSTSFVKSPVDVVVDLYGQYVYDLGNVLYRHAPLISRLTKKKFADCLSDAYPRANSCWYQFWRTWQRAKYPLNRSRLHHQIVWCNALVNKDKSDYYSSIEIYYDSIENYCVSCIKPWIGSLMQHFHSTNLISHWLTRYFCSLWH